MIVVKFTRVKEREMIAWMIVQCGDDYMQNPKESCRHVTIHESKANNDGNYVAENTVKSMNKSVPNFKDICKLLFNCASIHRSDANRCHKFMMLLMEGIKPSVVQKSMWIIEDYFLTKEADKQISHNDRKSRHFTSDSYFHPVILVVINIKRKQKSNKLIFQYNFNHLQVYENIYKKLIFDSLYEVLLTVENLSPFSISLSFAWILKFSKDFGIFNFCIV